ncbi:MAG: GNAT family N-acetyltransferase [Anaerolineales bacterium]
MIDTPRLTLRQMLASDFDDLMMIFGDPKVMDSFNVPPFSRDQMRAWLDRNLAHQEEHGYGLFSVILKSGGTLIGNCGLEHMQVDGQPAAELGYDFRSDFWNQGYATEAATAVREYAFQKLNLPHLISLIRVGNEASRRVSEKIGMALIKELTINDIRYWKYGISS